jgi:hypothetical protein
MQTPSGQNRRMTNQPEPSEKIVNTCFLIGIALAGIALLAPDAGPHPGSFFQIAAQATWGSLFEMQAAWCSLKIVFLSLGLVLILNALGLRLMNFQNKRLTLAVLACQAVIICFAGIGFFLFLKALL